MCFPLAGLLNINKSFSASKNAFQRRKKFSATIDACFSECLAVLGVLGVLVVFAFLRMVGYGWMDGWCVCLGSLCKSVVVPFSTRPVLTCSRAPKC